MVGAEVGTDHSHPDLAYRFFHRQGGVGELSVQPEVYVNCQTVVVRVPEVLSPGIRGREYVSVHQARVLGESALRTEDADR